jgi:hypothetical protein
MSLEQDIAQIQEDMFKPASKEEIKKRQETTFPFLFMRFYEGGGLARFKWVKTNDNMLETELRKFEEECIDANEGERIGFLTPEEIEEVKKFI